MHWSSPRTQRDKKPRSFPAPAQLAVVPGEALHCSTAGGATTAACALKFSEEIIKKNQTTAFTTRIIQKHCSATFNCRNNCEGNGWAEEPLQQVAHCGSTVFTHRHMHTKLCTYCCLPNHALKHHLSVWNRSKPSYLRQSRRCHKASPHAFPTCVRS